MWHKREIEKKFVIIEGDYATAVSGVSQVARAMVRGTSFDTFWEAPGVDFVRFRDNTQELTVKVTDRATVTDRIEENAMVYKDHITALKRLLNLLYGPPALRITKIFSVFEAIISPAPGTAYKAHVSVYKVEEDPQNRIFFEVEADSMEIVDLVLKSLNFGFQMQQESRSLFQIFNHNVGPNNEAA